MKLRSLFFLSTVFALFSAPLSAQYSITISPAALPSATIGVQYTQTLTATGGRGPYGWSLIGSILPSGLTLSSAGVISGVPDTPGIYSIIVQAIDQGTIGAQIVGNRSYQLQVSVPPLAITTTTLPQAMLGRSYSQSLVATGGGGNYTWSIPSGSLPPGIQLLPSGVLQGTPSVTGTYQFFAMVSSTILGESVVTATQPYTLTVLLPPLAISTTALPPATAGVTYSAALSATGGTGSYTWLVTGGALPPGITISASGVISGTPTVAGVYGFIVQASGLSVAGSPITATQQLSLLVNPPSLAINTTQLPAGTVGTSYLQSLSATGGSSYAWSVASGALPAGITLSSAGAVSGTPSASGNFSFVVQVASGGSVATQSLSLTINPAPLAISTTQLPPGTAGVPYSQALVAAGGTGNYTWSVIRGAVPAGLTLSAAGLLTGVPTTAGTFAFTVQASSPGLNGASLTATQSLTLSINTPALAVSTTQLPGGAVAVRYSQNVTATGGTPPYSWRISAGSLPPGLLMDASAAISGVPTAPGPFGFRVTVTDASGASAFMDFSISIAPPAISITTASLPGGSSGAPYFAALIATGGQPPYAWSISGGALPDGLSVTSTGAITGTPTTPGAFSFTLQVTDTIRQVAFQAYTVNITAGVKITTTALPAGVAGTGYSQQLAAAAGVPPYTWSINSGTLPDGMSLSTTTGAVSGTPTSAGAFSFAITVVDAAGARDTRSFTITITTPVTITTQAPLEDAVAGSPYTQSLAATGGTPPYSWTILSGTLPFGVQIDSATGRISGTPLTSGSFSFTVQATDSAKSNGAAIYTIAVASGLSITSAAQLPRGMLGTAYSQQLNASGGKPPYRWTTSGAMPGGLSLSSAGVLSGSPTSPGTTAISVSVTDGKQTDTKMLSVTIDVPPGPPVTIAGLPDSPAPATQPSVALSIGNTYPADITGQVTLTFAPDNGPDDPAVQLTSGGRTASFRIPAGSTQAIFTPASVGTQTGTVSGLITLSVKLTAAGVDVTPSPGPVKTVRVNKVAPVITSSNLVRTSSGFDLVIIGYSTPRDLTSAALTFSAAPGVTLSSVSTVVQLSNVFASWYQSAASAQFGTQFQLRIPFTVQGEANAVSSVAVSLTNSAGTSAVANAAF